MASKLTKEQAIKLGEAKFWEPMSYRERAGFQLFEELLCMPFGVFHEAVEKSLGRPVWTHEFGSAGLDGLKKEFLGVRPAPTFQEIVELIPADKRIIITTE